MPTIQGHSLFMIVTLCRAATGLPYSDEIEDILLAIMEDEFNTEVQDGSLNQVCVELELCCECVRARVRWHGKCHMPLGSVCARPSKRADSRVAECQ